MKKYLQMFFVSMMIFSVAWSVVSANEAIPEDGVCWVADNGNNRVVKFSPDGVELLSVPGIMDVLQVCVNPTDNSCWANNIAPGASIVKIASNGEILVNVPGFDLPSIAIDLSDGGCWVADYGTDDILKLDAQGNEIFRHEMSINAASMCVNPLDGTCWVADENTNTVIKFNPDGTECFRAEGFSWPRSISLDLRDGSCWICDYNHDQVVKLADYGTEILRVDIDTPYTLAVNYMDGTCWVADRANSEVVKLNSDGEELLRIPGMNYIRAISVNPDNGNIWVTSRVDNQIIKLTSDGVELARGSGLNDPRGVSVNPGRLILPVSSNPEQGMCWVADQSDQRAVKLSPNGARVFGVGRFYFVKGISANSSDGTCWVADSSNHQVVKLAPNGGEIVRISGFSYPHAVSVNSTDGTCWVTDRSKKEVIKLSSNGDVLARTDGFLYPHAVSVNTAYGSCWVADRDLGAAIKLGSDGTELVRVTGFDRPNAVSVNSSDGSCWVTDTHNSRVRKLSSEGAVLATTQFTGADPSFISVNPDDDGLNYEDHAQYTGSRTGPVGPGCCWVANYAYNRAVIKLSPNGEILLWITTEDSYRAGVAVNPTDGSCWVANHREVLRYAPNGSLISSTSWWGSYPYYITVNSTDGTCWVTDSDHKVSKISSAGSRLFEVAYWFYNPCAVAVNPNDDGTTYEDYSLYTGLKTGPLGPGACWVAGSFNNEIYKLSPNGEKLVRFLVADPTALAVNPNDGTCWIADHRDVLHVDKLGNQLSSTSWWGSYPRFSVSVNPNDGTCWVIDGDHNIVKVRETGGTLFRIGGFNRLMSLSVDPVDGTCWVADTYNNNVVKLDPNGTEIFRLGGFLYPGSVAVDHSDGTCWVGDKNNNQIVKVAPDGTEMFRVNGVTNPCAVSVEQKTGDCWVADSDGQKVLKLAKDGAVLKTVGGFLKPVSISVNSGQLSVPERKPDLKMSSLDINFSDIDPSEGETIQILANVHNLGDENAEGVVVRFFDGDVLIGEKTISSISHKSSAETFIDWTSEFDEMHIIKVVVDPDNAINESDETNNEATRSVLLGTATGGIEVTGSLSPQTVYAGANVRVFGKAVYTVATMEPVAGADVHISIQGNGQFPLTYTTKYGNYSQIITAPYEPGEYVVKVTVTDYTFSEDYEMPLTVIEAPGIDLVVSSLYSDPGKPVDGDPAVLYAKVRNVGIVDAENVLVRIYDGPSLVGQKNIALLASGAEETVSLPWAAAPAGEHLILAVVDPDDTISESNEGNNSRHADVYVYAAEPDVAPTHIAFSDKRPAVGQAIDITATLENLGGQNAENVVLTFYDGETLIGTQTIPLLVSKGGAAHPSIAYAFLTDGWHTIKVVADPDNLIPEADEDNNVFYVNVFVHLPSPDLAVEPQDITFSNTIPRQGDSVTIEINVHNAGELIAENVHVTVFDNNVAFASSVIPLIASESSCVITVPWTAAPKGVHNIKVVVDPDNIIPEPYEDNNAASRSIYVYPPPYEPAADLAVYSGYIVFSDPNPDPEETINIQVTVHNIGDLDAQDVLAVMTVDNIQIYSTIISLLPAGGESIFNTNWTAPEQIGAYIVKVTLDPAYQIEEHDKLNNVATRAILVGILPDETPPLVNDDYQFDGIWVNQDQVVTITATDEHEFATGVKEIKYSFGAGSDPAAGDVLESPYQLVFDTDQDTIVKYQAWDNADNASLIGEFNVKIDKTTPVIALDEIISPTNVAVQIITGTFTELNLAGIDVNGVSAAIGNGTFSTEVTLSEGENTIVATITDLAGNTAVDVATVVLDTIPPVLTVPGDITAEATGVLTPVDIGEATATDATEVTITNDAPSSGTYSLGTTVVTWTATDAAGNSTSLPQNVTIVDTTAPTVTITGISGNSDGLNAGEYWVTDTVVISYDAVDLVDNELEISTNIGVLDTVAKTVTIDPYTAVGEVTITISAQDDYNNIGSASAQITLVMGSDTITLMITPNVLNLNKDRKVKAHITFSESYDVNTVANLVCDGASPVSVNIDETQYRVIGTFMTDDMEQPIDITFVVRGEIEYSGTLVPFQVTDTIKKVKYPGNKNK
ncbi:MAG: hypothetical protein JW871_00555 [Endomicrobiales bacterium]|nr:hypothetical protein [Endomicrobiales bacterium]